jgi:hypothetical protein
VRNAVLLMLLLLLALHLGGGAPPAARRAVVIGGGVGGLVTSTLLARETGWHVQLIERHERCGGRMGSEEVVLPQQQQQQLQQEKYRFDRGPSLLLAPDVYERTFALLGEPLRDHVKLLQVAPLYRVYFEEDGTFAEISTDPAAMAAECARVDGYEGAYAAFAAYLRTASAFLRFGLPAVIEERPEWQHLGGFLLACLRAFPLLSHDWMLGTFFRTPKMRAMMSFQDLYIGLSPYEAPAVFSLLQALELDRGIFYPEGGFDAVARALEAIARKNGVEVHTNSSVVAISTAAGAVTSVDVAASSGGHAATTVTQLGADVFVTNVDAPHFEEAFVQPSTSTQGPDADAHTDTRTARGKPSCGIVQLDFAFDRELRCLAHHTLYLSSAYKGSWRTVEQPDAAAFNPNEFNFYVHAPSRTDRTTCPPGHDAVTVLVPVPPLPLDSDGSGSSNPRPPPPGHDLATVRRAVLDKLQAMENAAASAPVPAVAIEDHIVAERAREPAEWKAQFGLFRGSAFGLAHNLDQLSILRPRIRHPSLKNLYRVGASTRPGNGVPLVMVGARLTAEAVLRDVQQKG